MKGKAEKLVVEGLLEVGPKDNYFAFLDGEYLARLLLEHFNIPQELGYKSIGRVRITVERLED